MYQCVSLNKKNLEAFKYLNNLRGKFNCLNEDFFNTYDNYNFAQQMLIRRKVKLLKKNSEYLGYIWTAMDENDICIIKSLNILNRDQKYTNYRLYKYLIDTIKDNCIVSYICENNNYNFNVLDNLGFRKREGTLVLFMNLDRNMPLLMEKGIEFQILRKGKDEDKRCLLQNDIFEDDTRVPLTLEDIYYDEMQEYYFDKGAVFIKKEDKYIGYGQIIMEGSTPVIVNFGILEKYRGKGYGKYLLSFLLKVIQTNGFDKVKIKVKNDNNIALNLYKSVGFKIKNECCIWQLNNK